MGKRARKRREGDEGPVERPEAVERLLGDEGVDDDGTPVEQAERQDADPDADGAGPAKPKGRHPAPDGRLREVSMLVEEADYVLHLYRWILLTAQVPRAQDWLRREDWPHPDHVIDVFGSWDKFVAHAEVPDSLKVSGVIAERNGAGRAASTITEATTVVRAAFTPMP